MYYLLRAGSTLFFVAGLVDLVKRWWDGSECSDGQAAVSWRWIWPWRWTDWSCPMISTSHVSKHAWDETRPLRCPCCAWIFGGKNGTRRGLDFWWSQLMANRKRQADGAASILRNRRRWLDIDPSFHHFEMWWEYFYQILWWIFSLCNEVLQFRFRGKRNLRVPSPQRRSETLLRRRVRLYHEFLMSNLINVTNLSCFFSKKKYAQQYDRYICLPLRLSDWSVS